MDVVIIFRMMYDGLCVLMVVLSAVMLLGGNDIIVFEVVIEVHKLLCVILELMGGCWGVVLICAEFFR